MITEWTILDSPDVSGVNTEQLTITDTPQGLRVQGTLVVFGRAYAIDQTFPWPAGPPDQWWDQWFLVALRDHPGRLVLGVNTDPTARYPTGVTVALGWRTHPAHPQAHAFAPNWAVQFRHRAWDMERDGPHHGWAVEASGHVTRWVPGQGEVTVHPPRVAGPSGTPPGAAAGSGPGTQAAPSGGSSA